MDIFISVFSMEKNIQTFDKIQKISYILIAFVFVWLSVFYVRNFTFAKGEEIKIEKQKAQTHVFQDPLIFEKPKNTYDFISDGSLQKYLSAQTAFQDKNYKPIDLFPIKSDFTYNDSTRFSLREDAGIWFSDLAWNFWNENDGAKLQIISAYRSNNFQNMLLKNWCSRQRCALAWTSEHQAWLALDLQVNKNWKTYVLQSGSVYFERLKNNAHRFWFHNTYQKWLDIDGQMIEARHWRYLGLSLAKILYENNQSFAEYYNKVKKEEG